MFVGHGILAFVLAWVVLGRGRPRREAVAVGVVAAGFGTLPDVDMVVAPLGLLSGVTSLAGASAAFWETAGVVHRTATHSLVVGGLVTGAVAAWDRGESGRTERGLRNRLPRLAAIAIATTLVVVTTLTGGAVGGVITGLFLAGALGIATVARRFGLGRRRIVAAAGIGLLTHPFGDLLTGEPPPLLYPLEVGLLEGRVVLAGDPTVNLLCAFFVELAVIWVGLATVARIGGWPLGLRVHNRAGLGVGYAGALVAVPAPSIDAAAPFVVSVLAVGLVAAPLVRRDREGSVWDALVTGTAAVTVAGMAYLAAYLALG